MKPVETEHHVRKMIGGVALIVAPIFGLVGMVTTPRMDSTESQWLSNLAAGTDRAWWGLALGALGLALGLFAILALAHMLRERAPAFGDVGGAAAMIGLALSGVFLGFVAMATELARSSVDIAAAAKVLDDATTNPIAILAIGGTLLFSVGLLVLAVGLFRTEGAPVFSAIGIGLFAVGSAIGYLTFSTPVVAVAFAVLAVALAPLGWQVVRESDEAWEHTPRFEGFRAQTT